MSLTTEELARTAVWRDSYFATTDKEARKVILKDAAAAFGIRPGAVYKRWSDNGRREGVKADSVRWFRRKLGIPPGCRQRRAVLGREVAIYVQNWPDMTAGEVYRSIVADDEIPFDFNRWSVREIMLAMAKEAAT